MTSPKTAKRFLVGWWYTSEIPSDLQGWRKSGAVGNELARDWSGSWQSRLSLSCDEVSVMPSGYSYTGSASMYAMTG